MKATRLPQRPGLGFILVAAAAATWGSEGLFRRGLALELPSGTIVMVEHLILVAITLPLLLRAAPATKLFTVRDWLSLVAIGVGASALATVLFTQAFTYGDPNTPLLLQKLQPFVRSWRRDHPLGREDPSTLRYLLCDVSRWRLPAHLPRAG